jgi:transposase, IS5 family
MRQLTLATAGFERYAKSTRRAAFLAEMDLTVPWRMLCALIEPVYPKPGNGRPPVGLERMLRIYFLQLWFNLSDPAVEEALYESASRRQFVGIDLGREPAPDETTVCKFRHLLEKHDLGRKIFERVHEYLSPWRGPYSMKKHTPLLPFYVAGGHVARRNGCVYRTPSHRARSLPAGS